METLSELSLRLWRDVGRQDDLQAALQAALQVAQPVLGTSDAAIRLLIPEHRLWETVAAVGGSVEHLLAGVDRIADHAELSLPAELRERGVQRIDPRRYAAEHPGLVSSGLKQTALLCVLSEEPRATALLVLCGLPETAVTATLRETVLAMKEPLACALRHYVKERDAVTRREAAEADRRSLLNRLGRKDFAEAVVGAESGLRDVMERVAQVARSDAPVLLLGETGSGKEVVARAIHRQSPRADGPFIRVNCGAIPGDLIDSELFGHERGSFTGAVAQRRGWFERADGGTLFLDEVAELPLPAQVRLLRVLQDGLVQRVGAEHSIAANVRVIAATHQDLQAMRRDGRFREDLWYRLAVFPIELPALRERLGDVPALAGHFAQRAAGKLGLAPCPPSDEDIRQLCAYDWPGNIRELASVIERAAILGDGRRLEVRRALGIVSPAASSPRAMVRGLPEPPQAGTPESVPHPGEGRGTEPLQTFDEQARAVIETALRRCLGRVDGPFGAARQLGVNPQTLRSRMKRLGIDPRPFRARR